MAISTRLKTIAEFIEQDSIVFDVYIPEFNLGFDTNV